eukprot:CAMPEP_0194095366 /NCGR_PEP_ID=MMETSP0149-20130528/56791_1 /TAXON_ID=122233 /ORGANISM="Chaetoceros debilis, Strain MM31A-1" /LENGTH=452 /DNA_ID=CAMNT_0038781307 /DNA_START=119 /DNA_END=1480 /DNA_ORIENTATION=-
MPSIISINSNLMSTPSSESDTVINEIEILSALSFTPSFDSQDDDNGHGHGHGNGDDEKVLKVKNDNNDDSVSSSSIESTVEDVDDNDDGSLNMNHSCLSDEFSVSSLEECFRPCINTNQTTFSISISNSLIRRRSCMSIRTLKESIDKEKYSECMNQARERKSLRFESRRRDNDNENGVDGVDIDVNVYDELRRSLADFKFENKTEISEASENSNSNSNSNSNRNSNSNESSSKSKGGSVSFHYSNSNSNSNSNRNSNSNESSSKSKGGSVSFHSVSIQLYPIILGFNPAVSKGPPITMDWQPFAQCCVSLDTYETKRLGDEGEGEGEDKGEGESASSPSSSSFTRRKNKKKDLKISSEARFDILQRSGEEYETVRHRTREIKWIQDYRTETVAKVQSHSKFDSDISMEEKLEGIKKKCRKMFLGSQHLDKMRTKKLVRENKRVDKADNKKG